MFIGLHSNEALVCGSHSFSQPHDNVSIPGEDLRTASQSYLNSRPDSPRKHAHFGGPTRHCIWRISAWLASLCTAVQWGCSWWCKHRLAPLWNEAASQELRGWTQGGLRHCQFLQNRRGHENTAYIDSTCPSRQSITHTGSKNLGCKILEPINTACS